MFSSPSGMHLAGNCSRAKSVNGGDHKLSVKALLFSLRKESSRTRLFCLDRLRNGPLALPSKGDVHRLRCRQLDFPARVGKLVVQMGCALSSTGDAADPAGSEDWRGSAPGLDEEGADGSKGEGEEAFPLSQAQKERIRESWNILHKNIARVGIIVFIGLFETHPECKDVFFLFRDVDDLQQLKMSKELQAHGLRVMSFIEKSVARLDQEPKLEALAFELGKNHFHYKAPPNYYEYIGIQFIQAVRPILKDDWTLEVEKAWQGLFRYLVAVMHRGFHNEGKRLGGSPLLPPQTAEVESTPDQI
ncbi:neuroglobin-like [Vipera latastei]